MKQAWVWLGAIGTGAVAWFASGELLWPARLVAAVLLGPLPVLFMLQAQTVESLPEPLPRVPVYLGSIAALWLMAAIAFAAGLASGFAVHTMGLVAVPAVTFALWTIAALLGAVAVVALFKAFGSSEADIMRAITPVTVPEKAVFVGLSVSAGICEELTFRGFLMPALAVATGSTAAGIALSSLAFGVLHAHQRGAGVLRAATLGALLAIPVMTTGSIYASMTAHALVDIIGGLWLARWLFR